jgi:hypothetical protein
MLKFAVSAWRIYRPNAEHPPEGLFTEVPGIRILRTSLLKLSEKSG